MLSPHRAAVECAERGRPGRHVGKATQPHEAVGIVGITKHAENDVANGLLRLDELAFKEIDQRLARAGVECVTAQLDDAAPVHVFIMTTTTGSAEDLMRPGSRAPRGRRDVAEGLERPRRCPRFSTAKPTECSSARQTQ